MVLSSKDSLGVGVINVFQLYETLKVKSINENSELLPFLVDSYIYILDIFCDNKYCYFFISKQSMFVYISSMVFVLVKMLKLFNKSSVLGTSTRLLASASVAAPLQHEHGISSKKAVVLNMAGCVVPAMSPVLMKYAQKRQISESELISKLFQDGDKSKL